MDGTYQKQDEGVSQHSDLPVPEGCEIYRIESCQFYEWAIEQLHVIVEVRMPEKEPVWKAPTNDSGKETTYIKRLEGKGTNQ